MMSISVSYPKIIELEDGNQVEITTDVWKNRQLVVETDRTEKEVREIFEKEGFKTTIKEFVKNNQLGSGMVKKIDDWQVHFRFFQHGDHIQIDGEVEVSSDYTQHLTHGWISAFKESMDIISRHFNELWVYHTKLKKYVKRIVKENILELTEPKTKTDVIDLLLIGIGALSAGLLVASALKK